MGKFLFSAVNFPGIFRVYHPTLPLIVAQLHTLGGTVLPSRVCAHRKLPCFPAHYLYHVYPTLTDGVVCL